MPCPQKDWCKNVRRLYNSQRPSIGGWVNLVIRVMKYYITKTKHMPIHARIWTNLGNMCWAKETRHKCISNGRPLKVLICFAQVVFIIYITEWVPQFAVRVSLLTDGKKLGWGRIPEPGTGFRGYKGVVQPRESEIKRFTIAFQVWIKISLTLILHKKYVYAPLRPWWLSPREIYAKNQKQFFFFFKGKWANGIMRLYN